VRFYDPSGHDACPKALLDQMKRQGIPDVVKINIIKDTIKELVEKDFSLKKKVNTLSKKAKGGKYKTVVFRCLNKKKVKRGVWKFYVEIQLRLESSG